MNAVAVERTKYCYGCQRSDLHVPLRLNRRVTVLLVLLTLGLAILFWPYRCVTCGSVRPRSRILSDLLAWLNPP
jgi:hypothetical protein